MFEEILENIKKYSVIVIHRHKNPDGDAMGSQLGLLNIIKDTYPEKEVYAVGDAAGRYAFMDADGELSDIDDKKYSGALAIILDTSASALISDERYKLAEKTLRIDHHIFCEKIADTEVTDTSYESCCGLITALAMEGGLTVSKKAAKLLYTGMITDSGRFRYDSTSAQTFRLASFLFEREFDTADIYRNLYSDDLSMVQLRARFILKIAFAGKNVAYIYTPIDEARSYGVSDFTLSRGMVNTMGEIRGIDIWANFTETSDGVLCELRSSKYNINQIAVKHGGGGHEKASGATLKDKNEAMQVLSELVALTEEK